MKKRYIIYLGMILLVLVLLGYLPQAVLPVIQLPGEVLVPNVPVVGGLTNTFVATVITYIIVAALALSLRARSRTADEVPTGFYNAFEAFIEGAYGFVENAAGKWARNFFPFFMTFILVILTANWLELIPGVDSIGKWENLPHFKAENALHDAEDIIEAGGTPLEAVAAAGNLSSEGRAHLIEDFALTETTILTGEQLDDFLHELEHEVEVAVDEANVGDLQRGVALLRAPTDPKPEDADWTIVPFVRVPATDLNFTIALAIISVVMTQVYGFQALGLGYLSKFFTFDANKIAKNPLGLMDTLVGIIEFVSEIAKILSFSFRLLGNIFAGQVLLFVIGFIFPVALVAVYGLEFFVGAIQAIVFAMLTLTFMAGATVSHHHEEDGH